MKLLEEFQELSEAEEVAKRLEAKGILTFVSQKRTLRNTTFIINLSYLKSSLWVVLNHQYTDGVLLLKDNNYVVKTALTPEEMRTLKEQSKISTFKSFNTFIAYSSVIIILILVGVYFAAK